jgi:large subunit ribosomal protein L10
VLRSEKKDFVAKLEDLYNSSSAIIVTHYHGLTVSQITALRRTLRSNGAGFMVVKNTLADIAARNVSLGCDESAFVGPTAIAYSSDPVAVAKGVCEFAKAHGKLKVICGVIDRNVIDAASVEKLAKTPPLNELRGKIVGLLQAPASKIVGVLQAPASQLVRLSSAYSSK